MIPVVMEGNSGESGSDYFDCAADRSGSDYFDCATDRSGSSSDELEYQLGPIKEVAISGEFKGRGEVQRIRRFRRIVNNQRQIENAKSEEKATVADSEVECTQPGGDGYELCGYELRAPPRSTHALRRLSMDATAVHRKVNKKSQSMRSKVQDEVMKVLFGPSDAKTPDEDKYELVKQEEVSRGVARTGILFRFSMWATIGFITCVLGGRRAKIGCSEFFPSVRERDPVPKVIVRKQTQ